MTGLGFDSMTYIPPPYPYTTTPPHTHIPKENEKKNSPFIYKLSFTVI